MPTGSGIAGYVGATGRHAEHTGRVLRHQVQPGHRQGHRLPDAVDPLHADEEPGEATIVGVFQILNKRSRDHSPPTTRASSSALSVHAAIAVENARLYEQERQKIAMEKDLQAAREVQMTLIPKRVPEVPGYKFAAVTITGARGGGRPLRFHREGAGTARHLPRRRFREGARRLPSDGKRPGNASRPGVHRRSRIGMRPAVEHAPLPEHGEREVRHAFLRAPRSGKRFPDMLQRRARKALSGPLRRRNGPSDRGGTVLGSWRISPTRRRR